MPRRDELGVAVVGCGQWGGNYVRLLPSIGVGRVVACETDPERLAQLARQHAGIETETRLERVLERPDVDAVIVATTAATHHELARAALEAGKHVLVEKPFAQTSAEGRDLVELARRRDRTLMVGHTFLYNPAVRLMREYIVRGEVGTIYYLDATRTHLGLVRRDVTAVWDLATHDISIFGYLLGARPERVSATGARCLTREREDVAFITLTYPGNVLGSIFVSWVDSNKVRQVALVGSRARLLFDDLDNQERLRVFQKGLSLDRPYADFGEFQLLVRDGDILSPRVETAEPLRLMTEHFLDCCIEGRRPLTDGEAGVEVVRVLEAIDRSIAAGGAAVELSWTA